MTKPCNDHTYEEVAERFSYDPLTGLIWSKIHNRPVGYEDPSGYVCVSFSGNKHYRAHRLAWLLTHGRWPEHLIDHINGVRNDNRITNLREATQQQNLQSRPMHKRNKLGVKGVIVENGRFRAQLWHNGKFVLNTRYKTIEEAIAAYQAVSRALFGEWHRA
jgi:hypothetical protein